MLFEGLSGHLFLDTPSFDAEYLLDSEAGTDVGFFLSTIGWNHDRALDRSPGQLRNARYRGAPTADAQPLTFRERAIPTGPALIFRTAPGHRTASA